MCQPAPQRCNRGGGGKKKGKKYVIGSLPPHVLTYTTQKIRRPAAQRSSDPRTALNSTVCCSQPCPLINIQPSLRASNLAPKIVPPIPLSELRYPLVLAFLILYIALGSGEL